MTEPIALAVQVNEILSKYIFIHDDIFKLSIRKLIPIPGIFKKIDFKTHYKNLGTLSEELSKIENEIGKTQNNSSEKPNTLFVSTLGKYAASLNKTIKKLYSISHSMYKKSEGEIYSVHEYNQEMDIYNQYIEQYRNIGLELNSLL